MTDVEEVVGKTARAICERTETVSLGRASSLTVSHDTPMNSEIAIAAMIVRVCAAFFDCGRLNASTPFEIDSTPVNAADPDANAFSSTNTVTAPVPAGSGCGTTACGHVPTVHFAIPTPSIA